jgi:hypothetical protein
MTSFVVADDPFRDLGGWLEKLGPCASERNGSRERGSATSATALRVGAGEADPDSAVYLVG